MEIASPRAEACDFLVNLSPIGKFKNQSHEMTNVWREDFANHLCAALRSYGYKATLTTDFMYHPTDLTRPIFLSKEILVTDVSSQEFFCIDPADDPDAVSNLAYSYMCRKVLKLQYHRNESINKSVPFTYFCRAFDDQELVDLRNKVRTSRRLFFRGEIVKRSYRKKILENLSDLIEDYSVLAPQQYFDEMTNAKVGLSLSGWGEWCARDIESFAVGTPLIVPPRENTFHNPLMPDYHYISAGNPDVDVHEAIRQRYNEVIDDEEYLRFVADNAMKWYDYNVKTPHSAYMALNIMGIRKKAL